MNPTKTARGSQLECKFEWLNLADSNVNTIPAVRSYRRIFFYYFAMIWIRLHILPEYLCFHIPLACGTTFLTLYRIFDLVLAQKEDCYFMSYQ